MGSYILGKLEAVRSLAATIYGYIFRTDSPIGELDAYLKISYSSAILKDHTLGHYQTYLFSDVWRRVIPRD